MSALLSYPDRTLAATLSGGSWLSALPVSNLKNSLLSQVSRTSDALAASSTVLNDLGATYAIRVLAICGHNCSKDATIRIRGYSDSGYTTMVTGADTGTVTVWPAGYTADQVSDAPKNWTYVFTSSKTARYWKAEITDTGNSAGYVELGRLWIGEAFEPATGIQYGASLGYESRDVIEESLGGVRWAEKREPRRTTAISFPVLSAAEKRTLLILQKTKGTANEIYWVMNGTASTDDMVFEAFPATMASVSPLSYPYYNNNDLPMELIEIV